jgi:hypothetical protein
MLTMNQATVIRLDNTRRLSRAVAARRRLRDAGQTRRREIDGRGGRVWVNGGELGGARTALTHLAESYD